MVCNIFCISVAGKRLLFGWPLQKLYDMLSLRGTVVAEVVVDMLITDEDIVAILENDGATFTNRWEKEENNDLISKRVT